MATKLSTFIEEVSALKLLEAPLKRIRELHRIYSAVAPPALLKVSRVGYLNDNSLVLIVSNGTAGASLRQQLPTLLANIQALEPQITAIKIEVQVGNLYTSPRGNTEGKERRLSPAGAKNLTQLANELPDDSPLQQAVKRLAGRVKSDQD
ncbi:MAG: DciA family protein [Pseudomonadota bacterium]